MEKAAPLCEKPRDHVFTGPDKYLALQKHVISEHMFPVMEFDSYFILVKRGAGQFIINGQVFPIRAGCVAWIQASQVLTIHPAFGRELELWVCAYEYQLINYFIFNQVSSSDELHIVTGVPVLEPGGENMARIAELFEQFETLSRRHTCGSAVVRSAFLREIELLVNREAKRQTNAHTMEQMPLGRRVSLYIAMNSTQRLTAASVAKAIDPQLTEAAVNHALVVANGMRFNQYLVRARVLMAASYFLYYSLPFDYIASRVGFDIDVTFYRHFKRLTGMTPQTYREQMLSDGKHGRVYRKMIISETIISAINYLYENLSEYIDVETLSRELYVSGSLLRIQFKDCLNTNYKSVLSQFRVRYAEALLATTDMPVVDISIESGFSSDRTLSRVFCDMNGISPGEFRRRRRGRRNGNGGV